MTLAAEQLASYECCGLSHRAQSTYRINVFQRHALRLGQEKEAECGETKVERHEEIKGFETIVG